jgi:TolA-binding protein
MRPHRVLLILLTLCLAAAVGCATGSATPSSSKRAKAAKGPTVSKYGHGKITAAQDLMEQDKNDEARAALEALSRDSKLNSYEMAVVNRLLASLYMDMEPEQHDAAIAALTRARDLNALPENEQRDVEKSIGQVYLAADRPADAVPALEAWYAKLAAPQATDAMLLANANAQIEDDPQAAQRAIDFAKQAIAAADPPKPEWIEFLASLYQVNDRETEVIALLDDALATGKLQPSERVYQRIAQSYVALDQEPKAIPYLEKAAALATHGRLDLWLAQLHLDAEDFAAAEASAQTALRKGGLPDEGQVYYLLGVCQFNLKKREEAKASFQKVASHPRLGKSANDYLKYIARGAD